MHIVAFVANYSRPRAVELSSIVDILMRSARAARRDTIEKKYTSSTKNIHRFIFNYLPRLHADRVAICHKKVAGSAEITLRIIVHDQLLSSWSSIFMEETLKKLFISYIEITSKI